VRIREKYLVKFCPGESNILFLPVCTIRIILNTHIYIYIYMCVYIYIYIALAITLFYTTTDFQKVDSFCQNASSNIVQPNKNSGCRNTVVSRGFTGWKACSLNPGGEKCSFQVEHPLLMKIHKYKKG
jgi:hypothetical protein